MLADLLEAEVFAFLMLTVRLAPMFMLMPIIGEQSVPRRFRVMLAALLALVLMMTVYDDFPPVPASAYGLLVLILAEFAIGLMLGLIGRMLLGALHTAGTIIAFQTGLAAAQNFDPSQGNQTALVASTMTIIGVTMLVVTDMHHMIIRAAAHSYQMFPPGTVAPIEDFTRLIIHYVAQSFYIGAQMAAPFMVYAIIYNSGLGIINRLVPRVQVFFVALPVNVLMGLTLLSILLPSMMLVFLTHFSDLLQQYMG